MLKKDDVKIGGVYVVRLHGKMTKVRIEEETSSQRWVGLASSGKRRTSTHWSATNLATGRRVVIKSAAKLRKEVNPEGGTPAQPKGVFNMGPKGEEHADVGKPGESI